MNIALGSLNAHPRRIPTPAHDRKKDQSESDPIAELTSDLIHSDAGPFLAVLYGLLLIVCAIAILFPSLSQAQPAAVLPGGANVVSGNISITQPNAASMVIQQRALKGIIDWQNFSIGAGKSVHFQQDLGSNAMTLNRVVAGGPKSEIFGALSATGKVFLVNAAGVYFAPGASVDVAGFVGSTLNLSNAQFLTGNYQFNTDGGNGVVRNDGMITANGGFISLIGRTVDNRGTLRADGGSVVLAAGDTVTLALGDSPLNVRIDRSAVGASIHNSGAIAADGGRVLLTARGADALLDSVVNSSGTIRANALLSRNGEIILDGGAVTLSGAIDARGSASSDTGGSVSVLGRDVALRDGARINANGATGGGTVLIGGNWQGQGPQPNATTTTVEKDVMVEASALENGDGGKIVTWADGDTRSAGTYIARGGASGGNGGRVEVSGHNTLNYSGRTDASAPSGKGGLLFLDPTSELCVTDAGSISGIACTSFITASSLNSTTGADVSISNGAGRVIIGDNTSIASPSNFEFVIDSVGLKMLPGSSITSSGTLAGVGNVLIKSAAYLDPQNVFRSVDMETGSSINTGLLGKITFDTNGGLLSLGELKAGSGGIEFARNLGNPTLASAMTQNSAWQTTGALTLSHNVGDSQLDLSNAGNNWASLSSSKTNIVVVGNNALPTSSVTLGDNVILALAGHDATLSNLTQVGDPVNAPARVHLDGARLTLSAGATPISYQGIIAHTNPGNATSTTAGTVAVTGSGNVILGRAPTGYVDLDVEGGNLTLTAGNTSNVSNITVNGGTLAFDAPSTMSRLAVDGNATLTGSALTAINSYDLKSGTLNLNLGGTADLNKTTGGTVTLNGANSFSGALVMDGGTLSGTAVNTASLYDLQSGTVNIDLGGSASLHKTTSGTVVLNGNNSYAGATTIGGGTLAITTDSGLGNTGITAGTTINTGGLLELRGVNIGNEALTFNGGNLKSGSGTSTSSGAWTLTQGASITTDTDLNASGILSGNGNLSKSGTSTLLLSGANSSYGGKAILNGGTLAIANNAALGSTGNASGTVVNTGATLELRGVTLAENIELAGGSLRSTGSATNSSATNTSTGSVVSTATTGSTIDTNTDLKLLGVVSGSGNLSKSGNGTLLLSGVNGFYSGKTILNGGTLAIDNSNALGSAGIASGTTINPGATLELRGTNITENIDLAGGTLRSTGSATNINAFNSSTGTVAVSASSTIDTNTDLSLTGVISGSGDWNKTGSSTLALSGNNGSFAGAVVVNAGTLAVQSSSALGSASVGTTVNNGATLELRGGVNMGTESLTFNNASLLSTNGVNTSTGAWTIGGTLTVNTVTPLSTSDGSGTAIIGGGALTKTGSSLLTLGGTNTYTGITNVNAGTLSVSNNSALGTTASGTIVNPGATLDLQGVSTAEPLTFSGGALTSTVGPSTSSGTWLLNSPLDLRTDTLLTASSILSGTGSLSKNGGADLVLSAANSYNGDTLINNGTLIVRGNGTLGNSTGKTTISGGTTLDLQGAQLAENIVLGSGNGASATLLASVSAVNGVSATSTNSGGLTLVNNNTDIKVNGSATLSVAGVIGGPAALTKTGTGTLALSGASTYGGATTVAAGILDLQADNSLPNQELQVQSGATVQLNGHVQNVASLSGTNPQAGGTINLGAASAALNITDGAGNTFAGLLTGQGSLNKTGSGTQILAGANSYAGVTTVSAGTLTLKGAGLPGNASGATLVSGSGTLELNGVQLGLEPLNFNGGGLKTSGATSFTSGAWTLNNNLGIQADANLKVDGVISGVGNLIKNGSAELLLTGVNTYSGATTINAGTVTVQNSGTLGDTSAGTTVNGGATLALRNATLAEAISLNATAGTPVLAVLPGSSSISGAVSLPALGGNTAAIQVYSNAQLTVSGVISGGELIQNGGGKLLLSAANTYAGSTRMQAGELYLLANETLPDNPLDITNGATVVLNGHTQSVAGLSGTAGSFVSLSALTFGNNSAGTLRINPAAGSNFSFSGNILGNGQLIKASDGVQSLGAASTYLGNTSVLAGTLSLSVANALPTNTLLSIDPGAEVRLNNNSQTIAGLAGAADPGGNLIAGVLSLGSSAAGALTINSTSNQDFAGIITGGGTVSKAGSGTQIFSGSNSYNGATQIMAGTLLIRGDGTLGNRSGGTTINSGGTLELQGVDLVENITLQAGASGAPLLAVSGNAASSLQRVSGKGGLTLANTGDNTINVAAGASLDIAAPISGGSSSASLSKNGAGTLVLSSANSFSGDTFINEGLLDVRASNALGNTDRLSLGAGVNVLLNNQNTSVGGLDGASSASVNLGGSNGALTLTGAQTYHYAGKLQGAGSLTLDGSGTQMLSGNNSYSGNTTVNGGLLDLGSSSALPASTALAIGSSGTVNLEGFDSTVSGLSDGPLGGGGALNLGNGNASLTVNKTSGSNLFQGDILGSGNLIKSGAGGLSLGGTLSYSGTTTVEAGQLTVSSTPLPSTTVLTINPGAQVHLSSVSTEIAGLVGATDPSGQLAPGVLDLGLSAQPVLTINTAASSNYRFAGTISGNGGIAKSGLGSEELAGANPYAGTTRINAGTLLVSGSGTLGNSGGSTSVANGATLALNQASMTEDILLDHGGSATLLATGTGTSTLNRAAGQGSLTLASSPTGGIALNSIVVDGGATLRLLAPVNGGSVADDNTATAASELVKSGAGTLVLGAVNSYQGITHVTEGTLGLEAAGALPATTALNLDVNTRALLQGNSTTLAGLSGNGNLDLGTSGATLSIGDHSNDSYSFGGVLSGNGSLTRSASGSGVFTLTGINTYDGATTIAAGRLAVAGSGTLGNTAGATTVSTGGILQLDAATLSGEPLIFQGGNLETTGKAASHSSGPWTVNITPRITTTQDLTVSGSIGGNAGLQKDGAGTLTLAAANQYGGTTTVHAGTLSVAVQGALPASTVLEILAPADVKLNDNSSTIAGLASSGTLNLGSNSATTLTIATPDGNSQEFSGSIIGTGGLNKDGAGTQMLSGTNSNSGDTNINAGTLVLRGPNATLGGQNVTEQGGATLALRGAVLNTSLAMDSNNGSTPTLRAMLDATPGNTSSPDSSVAGAVKLASSSGPVAVSNIVTDSGVRLALAGPVTGGNSASPGVATSTLNKSGTGSLIFGGSNSYAGNTMVSAGTLELDNAAALPQTTVLRIASGAMVDQRNHDISIAGLEGGGTLEMGSARSTITVEAGASDQFDGTILGASGNTSGLTKEGAGTLALAGASSYGGVTRVNDGILRVSGAGKLGADTSGTVIASGAVLELDGATLGAESLSFNGGSLRSSGAASTSSGTWVLGTDLQVSNSATLTSSGDIVGTGSLSKTGSGVLALSGNNSYDGKTTVQQGTLDVRGASALPAGTLLAVDSTGRVKLNGLTLQIAGLSDLAPGSGGQVDLGAGAGTLTVNTAQNSSYTFSGSIAGSGALRKDGAGSQVLAGVNTYAGSTDIQQGTLIVRGPGTLGDNGGTTTVRSGATLELQGATLDETIRLDGVNAKATLAATLDPTPGNSTSANSRLIAGSNGLELARSVSPGSQAALSEVHVAGGARLDIDSAITGGSSALPAAGQTGSELLKTGTGLLVLNGNNTQDGAFVINAGTLRVAGAGTLGSTASGTTVNAAGVLEVQGTNLQQEDLRFVGGTLRSTGATASSSAGSWFIDGGMTVSTDAPLTASGTIFGSGTLTKHGSASLALSGSNNWSGAVQVAQGLLDVLADGALPNRTALDIAPDATVHLNDHAVVLASLSGASATAGTQPGALDLGNTNGSLTIDVGAGANPVYAGTITGVGSVTKDGAGTLTLANATSFTGASTVNSGLLDIQADDVLRNTELTIRPGALVQLNNSTLTIAGLSGAAGTAGTPAGGLDLGNTAGSVRINTAKGNAYQFAGTLAGTGELVKEGAGSQTLAGANTFVGKTSLNGGTLIIAGTGRLGGSTTVDSGTTLELSGANLGTEQLSFNGGTLRASGSAASSSAGDWVLNNDLSVITDARLSMNGVIRGAASLVKDGQDLLALAPSANRANNYAGSTTVSAGTLDVLGHGALPTTTVLTIAPGAQVRLNNNAVIIAGLRGDVDPAAQRAPGELHLGTGNGALTIDTAAATNSSFAGTISGSGALVKEGAGSQTLAGANSHDGSTTVNNGTLVVAHADALGSAAAGTEVNTGATLELAGVKLGTEPLYFNGGTLLVSADSSSTGDWTINASMAVRTDASLNMGGKIDGTGELNKDGKATLVLSGADHASGLTRVNAGTLALQGAGASLAGNVEVAGGAVLDLDNSSITSAIKLAPNATLAASAGSSTASGIISADSATLRLNGSLLQLPNAQNRFANTTVIDGSNTAQLQLAANQDGLTLGPSSLGQLSLASAGPVSQNGVLSVAGQTGITATGTSVDIRLDQANQLGGTVSVGAANGATLHNVMVRNEGSGARFEQLAGVHDLTLEYNKAGTPLVIEAGAVGGALAVLSGGDLELRGAVRVAGTSSLGAGGDVRLIDPASRFDGLVSVTGKALDFKADGDLNITLNTSGTANVAAANGALHVNGSVAGATSDLFTLSKGDTTFSPSNGLTTIARNFDVTSTNGDMLQEGPVIVGGTTTIHARRVKLGGANDFNKVIVTADSVVINDINSLPDLSGTVTGNVTTSSVGNTTLGDSGPLNVGGNLSGTGTQVLLGTVDVKGNASLTSTGSGAAGGISQGAGGTLSVAGASTLTAGSGNIILSNNGNQLPDVTVSGDRVNLSSTGSILVRDLQANNAGVGSNQGDVRLGTLHVIDRFGVGGQNVVQDASSTGITVGGDLSVAGKQGDINLPGPSGAPISVGGNTTLIGNNIVFNATGDLNLATVHSSANTQLSATGGVYQVPGGSVHTGGDLQLTAGTNIILDNTTVDGKGTLTAGSGIGQNNGSTLTVAGNLDASTSTGNINLGVAPGTGGSSVGGVLTVRQADAVKVNLSGPVNAVVHSTGNTSITSNGGNASVTADADSLDVTGNGGSVVIGNVVVKQDATFNANGRNTGISQSAGSTMTVDGTTTLTTTGNVDLGNTGNQLPVVIVTANNAIIKTRDDLDVIVNTPTHSGNDGNVVLVAGGTLDVSGTATHMNTSSGGDTRFGNTDVDTLVASSTGGSISTKPGSGVNADTITFSVPPNQTIGGSGTGSGTGTGGGNTGGGGNFNAGTVIINSGSQVILTPTTGTAPVIINNTSNACISLAGGPCVHNDPALAQAVVNALAMLKPSTPFTPASLRALLGSDDLNRLLVLAPGALQEQCTIRANVGGGAAGVSLTLGSECR